VAEPQDGAAAAIEQLLQDLEAFLLQGRHHMHQGPITSPQSPLNLSSQVCPIMKDAQRHCPVGCGGQCCMMALPPCVVRCCRMPCGPSRWPAEWSTPTPVWR
jgi:hypothetical protein